MSRRRFVVLLIVMIMINWIVSGDSLKRISFFDNFEKGLGQWDLVNGDKIWIVPSGDPKHGKVLALHSGGEAVYALVKNSHDWTNIQVEGDVCFPEPNYHHYMGFIYNYNVRGRRTDFGTIFILGPFGEDFKPLFTNYRKYLEFPPDHFLGNVLLVNPHRDSNASRVLYTEYWVTLAGENAVKPGEWHHFKAEVVGPVCHFYVDDMKTPKITYNFFEFSSGRVGFKPRFVGTPCWLDNIKVTSIRDLSYKGPLLPAGIIYKPDKLLNKWDFIGPFSGRRKDIEAEGFVPEKQYSEGIRKYGWQVFDTDGRGCVVAGRVIERFSGKWYAYFHTVLHSQAKQEIELEFSSSVPLVLWVNGDAAGEIWNQFVTWYDFWENPGHEGRKVKVNVNPGINHMVVLVKGGRYGGDGFYAYRHPDSVSSENHKK